MLRTFISLAIFIIAACAHGDSAYTTTGGKYPAYACNLQINIDVLFCNKTFDYACLCQNENALATYAGCLSYMDRINHDTLHRMDELCERGEIVLEPNWIEGALERFKKYAKSADEIEGFNTSIPIDVPFKLNETAMKLYDRSYATFLHNYDHSLYYGTSTLMYWLLIILIGAVTNWSKFLFPGFTKKLTGPFINFWRKHVSIPAAFGRKKTQEQSFWKIFDCLLPSRFESIVIFLFYVFVVVIHCINITALELDPVFDSKYTAEIRYVADRTGIVATIMMPLIILFAGRNNFLQWISGYNYTAFMAYHRHTARIMFCLVVIHAVGFSILFGSRYAIKMQQEYVIWGTVATVAGGIMLVQAMLYFRRRWYEIFLLIHIAMAVLWVVGTWIHVEELGYIWFVYPSVAIWVFDRAVRIGRLIVFGFPTSDVILLADETIKVVVPKPSYWKSVPGGHAFIHFLKPTYFWQSHPFTFTESVEQKDNIVLYVKVKGGITHSLYQLLAKTPGKAVKMKVAIEGPYGEPTAARTADTAVFVAGGNGIPGIYSEVVDIALRAGQNSKKVLKLVWVIREYRSLFWFYEELASLKNVNIETTIYVTKPNNLICLEEFSSRFVGSDISSSEISDKDSSREKVETLDDHEKSRLVELIKRELSHIEFKEGRPNIEELVREEVNNSAGSIGFVTCGHPVMVDELRYYCAQNISNPNKNRVDFYEQLQVWA